MILGFGLMLRVLALRRRMAPEVFGVLILLGGVALAGNWNRADQCADHHNRNSLGTVIGVSMAAPSVVGEGQTLAPT